MSCLFTMSKKNLNPDSVINELKGQSVFFRESEMTKPADSDVDNHRELDVTVRSVRDVRGVRNKSRETKRHAFDIYRDQLDSLKDLKLRSMMQGELKSMSEMVRDALDRYIEDND